MKTVHVVETLHGWSVQIGQEAVFLSADEEAAYKHALKVVSGLFEQGHKSQVILTRERRAA